MIAIRINVMLIPLIPTESLVMAHLDRLSSLISHFDIHACPHVALEESNFFLLGGVSSDGEAGLDDIGSSNQAVRLVLFLKKSEKGVSYISELGGSKARILVHGGMDIGGNENPLFYALPDFIDVDLQKHQSINGVANLIAQEMGRERCGGRFALDRLSELLVVHLLRYTIEHEGAEAGLFAGLAHPKLSSVLVAMHDNPGKQWQVEDFSLLAGMSRSHFIAEFQTVVGQTPIAYLKQWRMVLARNSLLKGERVNSVARKFGYRSADAFCRAFMQIYGMAPSKVKGPFVC